jgi:hypothetical protein
VAETLPRRYYLCHDKGTAHKTKIYISNDGQRFKTIHIGQALAKYFGHPKAATQIDKILCTYQDDEAAALSDDLLSSILNIPELPPSWEAKRGLEIASRTSTGSAGTPGRENDDPSLGRVVTGFKERL